MFSIGYHHKFDLSFHLVHLVQIIIRENSEIRVDNNVTQIQWRRKISQNYDISIQESDNISQKSDTHTRKLFNRTSKVF